MRSARRSPRTPRARSRPTTWSPGERVDAVTSGEQLGLALAEELRSLAPFGAGNPPVSLLLAAATFSDPVGFGGERRDQHARFTVRSGNGRARAVHFGGGPRPPVAADSLVDATFTLEVNEWQGVVEPRLVAAHRRAVQPAADRGPRRGRRLSRARPRRARPAPGAAGGGARTPRTARSPTGAATGSRLRSPSSSPRASSLLVLCADTAARHRHLTGRLGGFSLASHDALERGAATGPRAPPRPAARPPGPVTRSTRVRRAGGSDRERSWHGVPPELRFAEHIHEREYGLRDPLAACYRTLRDRGGAAGQDLEAALRGDGPQQRSPELAGRLLRVLTEIGLIQLDLERAAVAVTERRRVSLESSPAYRQYERRRLEGLTSLRASIRQAA